MSEGAYLLGYMQIVALISKATILGQNKKLSYVFWLAVYIVKRLSKLNYAHFTGSFPEES